MNSSPPARTNKEAPDPSLQDVADAVLERAQREGFVRATEIREELRRAGAAVGRWKEVVALARASLTFRRGRYYYVSPVRERLQQEQRQLEQAIRAARQLVEQCRAAASKVERRGEDRIDFIQPVTVKTEDGRTYKLVSRDLSTSGMRLIGTRSLLGQKLRVSIEPTKETKGWNFVLRILWTCSIGDGLFENGGTFVEASPFEAS